MTTVARKHLLAEKEVRPLLLAAGRVDPVVVSTFPRPLEDILGATFPSAAVERHEGLTHAVVREVLWRRYHRRYEPAVDEELAGFTYASGDLVVVLLETRHGPAEELFTLAHEMGHLAKEFLPMRIDGLRQLEMFDLGAGVPALLHADPPGNVGAGGGLGSHREARVRSAAWLREVVANKCAAELLAPHEEVARVVRQLTVGEDAADALVRQFALPRRAADVRLQELGLDQPRADQNFSLHFSRGAVGG